MGKHKMSNFNHNSALVESQMWLFMDKIIIEYNQINLA